MKNKVMRKYTAKFKLQLKKTMQTAKSFGGVKATETIAKTNEKENRNRGFYVSGLSWMKKLQSVLVFF